MLWIFLTAAAAPLQVARNALQRGLVGDAGPWGATLVRFLFGLPFSLLIFAVAAFLTPDADPHLSARFGQEVLYLHGGTPKKRRDEMVTRFQSDGGPAVFLLSLKAGGTGLNLTAANHVVHLDRWWNPAVENQATDRAFRIGQQRNVQVRKFICTGTLEEKIDEMIEEKKALADLVISDGEGWLTELSTDNLREVFALSEGAVGE